MAEAPSRGRGVTYAELRRICAHAGSARTQQTYNVLADSQSTRPPGAAKQYTLAPAEKAARRLGRHLRLAVEATVPLYSDQVPEYTLLRYTQAPTTAQRRRFQYLVARSHDGTTLPDRADPEATMKNTFKMEECSKCSPWRTVEMGGLMRSGGAQETLIGPGSDQDYMWEIRGVHLHGQSERRPQVPAGVFVAQVHPLQNDKFCLLYCAKQHGCEHKNPCLFPARYVRKLNKQLWEPAAGEKINYNKAGPAANLQGTTLRHEIDVDFVPCLHWAHWPWPRFQQRHRPGAWPPASIVEDIVGYGVHMVPIGIDASSDDWRMSTSRAEILLVRCLPTRVRMCLQMLKQMKNHVPKPLAKQLNSYIFKQTAFWMCEEGSYDASLPPLDVLNQLLARAAEFIYNKRLPHFFADHVNDLATFSDEHMQRLSSAIRKVRDNVWTLLLAAPCHHLVTMAKSHPVPSLTEKQVQECSARNLAMNALIRDLDALVYNPDTRRVSSFDKLNCQLASDEKLGHKRVNTSTPQCNDMVAACLREANRRAAAVDGSPAALSLLTDQDLQVVLQLDGGVAALDAFLTSQDARQIARLRTDFCKPLLSMTDEERCHLLMDTKVLYEILVAGPKSVASKFWRNANAEKLMDLQSINNEIITAKPDDPFRLFSARSGGLKGHFSSEMTDRDAAFCRARRLLVKALVNNLSNYVYDHDTGRVERFDLAQQRVKNQGEDQASTSPSDANGLSAAFRLDLCRAIDACPRMPGLVVNADRSDFKGDLSPLLALLSRSDVEDVIRLEVRQLDGLLQSYNIKLPRVKRQPPLPSQLHKPVAMLTGTERCELFLDGARLYLLLVANFPSSPGLPNYWWDENESKLKLLKRQQKTSGTQKREDSATTHKADRHEKRAREKEKAKAKRDMKRGC